MTHLPPAHIALHTLALAYLHEHGAEHDGCQQALFSRTARYLHQHHGASEHQAQVIAGQAYGQWRSEGEPRQLDLAASTPTLAALTDPARGLTYLVPVATIWRCLIDAPGRRPLRAVN